MRWRGFGNWDSSRKSRADSHARPFISGVNHNSVTCKHHMLKCIVHYKMYVVTDCRSSDLNEVLTSTASDFYSNDIEIFIKSYLKHLNTSNKIFIKFFFSSHIHSLLLAHTFLFRTYNRTALYTFTWKIFAAECIVSLSTFDKLGFQNHWKIFFA